MALEAVVFPQNPFSYSAYNMLGGSNNWSYDGLISLEKDHDHDHHNIQEQSAGNSFDFLENQTESSTTTCTTPYGDHHNWNPSASSMVPHFNDLHLSSTVPSPDGTTTVNANGDFQPFDLSTDAMIMPITSSTRPKRRRSRSRKNKEDIENQRMTHIAVERNRRKQMNEYLAVLRSLMPDSYVQRGDQASIIGGAINFVKELEQQVQFLGVQKEIKRQGSDGGVSDAPFSEFFTFPQYSTSSGTSKTYHDSNPVAMAGTGETSSAIADIEVTMVESHANIKIRSKRRPKQLLKMVSGLQSMRLTVLHLNVTTEQAIVLYSLSVKVEDDCKLTSVDDIATAVYQILARIQEETLMAN
ncbi:hypothetical protein L484_003559 [Morus notabilis]|uniref:BHLH domain-containing protein n=1 Tax=Morus notabilis TaxID=981085 RepID=W9SJQ3_9ROSA|nr:transcription factor bHLH94 [Morus notabilis]EXC12235.1 hypothetical protein L484_003559 [Morus notabilis]